MGSALARATLRSVTRPRSRAPGRSGSVYRRSRLPLLVSLAFAAAACIGSGTPASESNASPAASPVAATSPSTSAPAPTESPSAEPTPTAEPTPAATPESSPGESLGAGAGSVEGCTGSDDNRSFFRNAAEDLDWPVYCAALPARWFVSKGSYSLAGAGKLEISYKGPNGATLELREGGFCTDGTGCVPEGSDAGEASFGDQAATMVHFEDGRVAAVVGRGDNLSWLAVGGGLTDDAFRSLTSALIRLD
jgi:hypothetical protein